MSDSDRSVTTTIRAGPPKYQSTIPLDVREVLDTDGKEAIYQITVTVKKIVDEGEAERD